MEGRLQGEERDGLKSVEKRKGSKRETQKPQYSAEYLAQVLIPLKRSTEAI